MSGFTCCIFVVALVVAVHGDGEIHYDYYDINEVFNEFTVDCGTVDEPKMTILYGGNAYTMYAVEAPTTCLAQEVAPAVFRIDIDYENTNCPIESSGEPPVKMLNLVVQKGVVRQFSDPFKQITCNYGLGGQQQSDNTDTHEGNLVPRQPVWDTANDATTQDSVSLAVYGTDNAEVSTAYLGSYIQLRAFIMDNVADAEHSIKIFNCKAYTNTMSYYMLLAGCGEGDVIAANRGFRTKAETAYPTYFRVARSSYFKSFLLPGEETISFECDYILCSDLEQCDGLSCPDSVSSGVSARRKRSVPDMRNATLYKQQYPSVKTAPIKMLRRQESTVVEAGMLVRDEDPMVYRKSGSQTLDSELDETKIYLIAGVIILVVILLLLGVCFCVRSCLSPPMMAAVPYGAYQHTTLQSPCVNDSYYSNPSLNHKPC